MKPNEPFPAETVPAMTPERPAPPAGSRTRYALLVLALAIATSAVESVFGRLPAAPGHPGLSWFAAFIVTLPSWLLVGALVPAIFALCRTFPIRGPSRPLSILVHAAAALAFPIVHTTAYVAIMRLLQPVPAAAPAFDRVVLNLLRLYFGAEVIAYAAIVCIWYALHYHREALARERDAARLRADLDGARLEALRLQLNPHFLFNTLQAIAVMARTQETETLVRTVNNLADLLRSVLDEGTTSDVSLQVELAMLERYLDILSVRFRDRLTVVWDIGPECHGARVPALILQPLVENALIHGIESRRGLGTLTIRARRAESELEIRIDDSGPGFRAPAPARIGHGVGLTNTLARLKLRWGSRFRFETGDSNGTGGAVLLRLPFELADDAAMVRA